MKKIFIQLLLFSVALLMGTSSCRSKQITKYGVPDKQDYEPITKYGVPADTSMMQTKYGAPVPRP